MDLNTLMDLVNAKINDDARRAGVMTLGGLRSALAAFPPDTRVVVDVGGSPADIDSYRGYYERLAIEVSEKPCATADVVALLDRADGHMFHGYKGGEYVMGARTFLHVAPYGDCGPQIVGLRSDGDHIVIETEEEEF